MLRRVRVRDVLILRLHRLLYIYVLNVIAQNCLTMLVLPVGTMMAGKLLRLRLQSQGLLEIISTNFRGSVRRISSNNRRPFLKPSVRSRPEGFSITSTGAFKSIVTASILMSPGAGKILSGSHGAHLGRPQLEHVMPRNSYGRGSRGFFLKYRSPHFGHCQCSSFPM